MNLFSRFFSASALLSLSAFNLSCLLVFLSNLFFCFKVFRIEFTVFEISDRILTTDSFFSFLSSSTLSSFSSGLRDDGTKEDEGLTVSAPPFLSPIAVAFLKPPIAVPFLNASADIFVLFTFGLLNFITSSLKATLLSSPLPPPRDLLLTRRACKLF